MIESSTPGKKKKKKNPVRSSQNTQWFHCVWIIMIMNIHKYLSVVLFLLVEVNWLTLKDTVICMQLNWILIDSTLHNIYTFDPVSILASASLHLTKLTITDIPNMSLKVYSLILASSFYVINKNIIAYSDFVLKVHFVGCIS